MHSCLSSQRRLDRLHLAGDKTAEGGRQVRRSRGRIVRAGARDGDGDGSVVWAMVNGNGLMLIIGGGTKVRPGDKELIMDNWNLEHQSVGSRRYKRLLVSSMGDQVPRGTPLLAAAVPGQSGWAVEGQARRPQHAGLSRQTRMSMMF